MFEVAVIIPVYHDWENLDECLHRLTQQTLPSDQVEILIVDNGPDPDSARKAALESGNINVRYIHEPQPGSYSARNRAIRATQSPILAFTDADCRPDRYWLFEGVRALKNGNGSCIIGGNVSVTVDTPATTVEKYDQHFAFRQQRYIEQRNFAVTANLFAWRRTFDTAGAFNDQLFSGGDLEWGQRATRTGYQLAYCATAIVAHPARKTVADLCRQAARVSGGIYMLDRAGLVPAPKPLAVEVIYHCIPPIWPALRLLFDTKLMRGIPIRTRISFVWIKCLLHFAKGRAYLKIALGQTPERR